MALLRDWYMNTTQQIGGFSSTFRSEV